MASPRLIRTLALCGSLGLLAFPHFAKAEYGYKERIFEQKYVLPEKPTDDELIQLRLGLMLLGADPGQVDTLFSAELAQAMGGMCDTVVILKKVVSRPPPSEAQTVLTQAAESGTAQAVKMQRPEVPGAELCLAQTVLFKKAYADSLSTDRQLSDLAAATRRRFAAHWIAQAELQRPQVLAAAQRLSNILQRVARLAAVGVVVSAADGGAMLDSPIQEALTQLSGDEPYATIDRRLTEIEEEAVRSLEERGATLKQQQARYEEEARRLDETRRQELDRAIHGTEAPRAQVQAPTVTPTTIAANALDAAQARVARARQAVQSAERRLQERSAAIQADQARRMQSLAMGRF
ncbi:hypothetical protein [Roseixanthobacter pseudopolyaromaticivorans]|uniref:hypothetical protein n=1 Tax=Xanthobacteraceae TaxID=335928 RepID=UPI0037262261